MNLRVLLDKLGSILADVLEVILLSGCIMIQEISKGTVQRLINGA